MIPMKEKAPMKTEQQSTERDERREPASQGQEPRRESEARYRKLAERHRKTLDYLARN
jgi:hypothetical protein